MRCPRPYSFALIAGLLFNLGAILSALAQAPETLDHDFAQPSAAARPRTLWMWMNGNVTADGITRDLESMRRVGLGGALIFNVGEYIPKGPVDYGQSTWLDLMTHAVREADRLGLQIGMHNCPGWSSSGGPWITPELSMQQLVWSETKISGPRTGEITLPQPYRNLSFYRDICVLAFPSLAGEEKPFAEQVAQITSGARTAVNKTLLTDRDLATSVPVSPENPLVFTFTEPFEARAITVWYSSGGGTIGFTLEASDDGANFRTVAKLTPASPRAIEIGSLAESFEPVRAKYFRLIPARSRAVCEVELHAAARIASWNTKANFAYRAARSEALPAEVAKEFTIDPAKVIDLTGHMDSRGRLNWDAPAGNWTILRIGHTARGQNNIAAPDAGVGLECDKFSRAAVTFHFEQGVGKLISKVGPLAGKSFTGLDVDSYEVGMQNWTAGFENEFKTRNGYDLKQYLPALTGRYVGGAGISERFLWDFRRTCAELVADNYYGRLRELAAQHGLKLSAEPYGAGPGPYDELQVGGRADVPMGEFWAHFPWDDTASIRLAASAAHVHGEPIVAGESFTSTEEQSRFLDYPYALKTTGDLAFSLGLNQMYFHRFAHQPHPTAMPGMTMGPWGFNFDRNNTWFEKSSPWLEYLARCQFLLQQGTFVADVLYFTGEGSPQMSKRLTPELPSGYNFDAVDAETLLKRAEVKDGRIVLGGASYRVLMLPPDLTGVTLPVLQKLRDLVSQGAMLAGPKPSFSPSLRGYPASDEEVQNLAGEMWDMGTDDQRQFKRGQIFTAPITQVLARLGLAPDFFWIRLPHAPGDTALAWLHRRVGDADIYFVANRQRREEQVVCDFRVGNKRPEIWDPNTGQTRSVAVYRAEGDQVQVPLHFGPAESMFIVFRAPAGALSVTRVNKDGSPILQTDVPSNGQLSLNFAFDFATAENFTVCAWIKPDSDINAMPRESLTGRADQNNKSYVVTVPDSDSVYARVLALMASASNAPPRHSIMGIAAGRNGVAVIESFSNSAPAVLVSRTPIAGWTHLAVVYRNNRSSLYLNGKFDREGLNSGSVVHPGVGIPPPGGIVNYFDGDMTAPEVFAEALSETRIAKLAAKGLPEPELASPIEVQLNADGKVEANVWQAGKYSLDNGQSINVPAVAGPTVVQGPWQVSFPKGLGAPAQITLEHLMSLAKDADPGVKYFSGTATYRNSFVVSSNAIGAEKKLWLDLGRVAVMAEARVNGREVGRLWKPPFRVDITSAVRSGTNDLEVRVTNLLANRLIGDETLPAENEYDSRTRAIVRLPDWFKEGKPKPPGGRTTFATWHYFSKGDPLVESGLIGPVRILSSVSATF